MTWVPVKHNEEVAEDAIAEAQEAHDAAAWIDESEQRKGTKVVENNNPTAESEQGNPLTENAGNVCANQEQPLVRPEAIDAGALNEAESPADVDSDAGRNSKGSHAEDTRISTEAVASHAVGQEEDDVSEGEASTASSGASSAVEKDSDGSSSSSGSADDDGLMAGDDQSFEVKLQIEETEPVAL